MFKRIALATLALTIGASTMSAQAAAPTFTITQDARAQAVRIGKVAQPCANEDGSGRHGLPCRWDARRSGNGIGQSYTVFLLAGHRGQTDEVDAFLYDDGTVVVSK